MTRPRALGEGTESRSTAKGIAARLVKLDLGSDEEDIFRMIRHYTNHGLIKTVGAVHTGTGRSRLYSEEAVLLTGVLFRLNRLRVPVGAMKELLSGLRADLQHSHHGNGLMVAARALKKPYLVLVIPEKKNRTMADLPRLLDGSRRGGLPSGKDVVVIQLNRFLRA